MREGLFLHGTTGYAAIKTALKASNESRSLFNQFEIEQSRLQDFVHAAGLANEEEGAHGDQGEDRSYQSHGSQLFRANTVLLLNILAEINLALGMFARSEPHPNEFLSEPVDPDTTNLNEGYNALLKKISTVLRKAPESLGVFQSFTWSAFRKNEYEMILQRLARCNDLLHELLDDHQQRVLQKQQQEHNMELILTRESLSDIQKLVEAAQASKTNHRRSGRWQQAIDAELEDLASFKALYVSLLQDHEAKPRDIKIEASRIQIESYGNGEKTQKHPQALYKINTNEEKRVWINWQDKHIPADDCTTDSISSVEELAILLMTSKPDEFCTPACLGYSILKRDQTSLQPALILQNPTDFDPKNQSESLLHAFTTQEKPSLTHRVTLAHKLAQGLLYLHSVNWLHKALRSANILFFHSSNTTSLDVRAPFITGFDNSRRSRFDESTNEVPREGHMEAYRHPDTQVDGPRLAYRKTFDMYSFGLILAEIALWRPLVRIMDIEKTVEESLRVSSFIQERWLTSEPKLLRSLRAEVGEKYADAVETCLKGRDAFGIERRDVEISADTGMKIQRGFNAKVVRPLAEIDV